MTTVKPSADVAARRAQVMERLARKLDKYLPESGPLRPWTISEIETELVKDMNEIARDVIELRLDVDPERVVEKPRCPDCGRALAAVRREESTHKQTLVGPIRYARTYGTCQACGLAFPPSGQRVALRQGLL